MHKLTVLEMKKERQQEGNIFKVVYVWKRVGGNLGELKDDCQVCKPEWEDGE